MLSTTLSTPIFCAASAVSPTPSSAGDAEADAAGDAAAALAGPGGRRVERGQPLRRAAAGRRRRAAGRPSGRPARPRVAGCGASIARS